MDRTFHKPTENNGISGNSSSVIPKRLLVIDDEEVVRQVVQGFLSNEGWTVEAAPELEEAYGILAREYFPVILCDVHLTGNSTELLQTVREQLPTVQVIMFTGDPTISTAREAVRYGAYDYIPKPFQGEDLVRIVQHAHEKHNLLREQNRLLHENEHYRQQLEKLVEKRTDQLRESELRYRAIFRRAVDAILLVSIPSGEIIDYNIAAARLFNVKQDTMLGKSIRDYVGDQLDQPLEDAAGRSRGEWRLDRIRFSGDNGNSKLLQITIGKVELDDQILLQIAARDITIEQELRERNEMMELELMSEQRLAGIGLLVSGIAHNINTPLMGIYGMAQIIKMKHPEIKDVDSLITQVERINGIIRNLMWKSRQEQDQSYQEIDLRQLLDEELKFLEADLEFKHNVDKNFEVSDNLPTIMGRYSDFSQSIMNIVRNALDAMHERKVRKLGVSAKVSGPDICITVTDTGCGIAEENRDKLFIPFYTTKPVVGTDNTDGPSGTGLGLATVQKLLSPYGTRFEIDSQLDQGTSFSVYIPIAVNQRTARNHTAAESN